MQDGRITKALQYIAANYRSRITLDKLADECNLSRFHFARLFKKQEGISPVKYLRRYRVRAAAEMLLSDNRSVTEIALDSGFESIAKLDEAFRDYFGTNPSLFRKSQISNNRKTSGNKRIEPRTREEYSVENTSDWRSYGTSDFGKTCPNTQIWSFYSFFFFFKFSIFFYSRK